MFRETTRRQETDETQRVATFVAVLGLAVLAALEAELTFTNDSNVEVHEMVAVRIADGEDRPLEELLALPEDGR